MLREALCAHFSLVWVNIGHTHLKFFVSVQARGVSTKYLSGNPKKESLNDIIEPSILNLIDSLD